MKSGIFITMEGPDGSGKSTQIQAIKKFFEQRGEKIIITREPGGTTISEKIRELLLDRANSEMDPMAEALLYAAGRAQHVAEVIKPALEQGIHVICDRFVDSSIAYQGYGRELGDSVAVINAYAIRDCMPDITFLMKLNPEIGKSRIDSEKQDRIESEKIDFHNRVFKGYETLETEFPERIISIDATGNIDEISEQIIMHLEGILNR